VGLVEAAEKGPASLIVNRIKPKLVNRGEMLSVDDVLELLAINLIGIVPDDETIVTATNRGEAAVYDPQSQAGRAFLDIARRLNGEEVPFPALHDSQGVLDRLLGMFGRRRS